MKHTLFIFALLMAGCDGFQVPGNSDIDTLYEQVSMLNDRTDQLQRDTCTLYRQHTDLNPPPEYCLQKQLPPPPYTIQ